MNREIEAHGWAVASPLRVLRFLWGAAATLLSVLYTIILLPVAALLALIADGHPVTHLSRFWAWLIIKTCGVKVEMVGLENLAGLGPCVLVSNHQSFFDIFAALVYLPGEVRFVAKRELLRIPLFGFTLRHSNHITIDRQRGGQAIRRALEVSRLGYSIYVFAEGTRFSDNQVHPFSEGAAWLAIHTKLPCVPVAISGTATFFPRGAIVVVPGGRMRITVGKPIATTDLKPRDRTELTRKLEEAVRAGFVSEL